MSKKEKLTKEEKIEKAKKHLEVLQSQNLVQDELDQVAGGLRYDYNTVDAEYGEFNLG